MSIFILSCLALVIGYILYGSFVERVFGADSSRVTPAVKYQDGVDYIPMPVYKIFLIQFLNIAGLGPVFGALMGAVYGPVALLWIVFGSIFAGGIHDYISGMISLRGGGKSLVASAEQFFGRCVRLPFILFLGVFLSLVGAVFATNPAAMMAKLTSWPFGVWICVIFGYYFIATLLPVDKIIGRLYPFFALLLLIVTVSLLICLFMSGLPFYPDLSLTSHHPNGTPFFPIMFVTIACGALSGFHATQSPMMARCLPNEKYARPVFYGAMIAEGFVALVWATLGIAFYQQPGQLNTLLTAAGPGGAIDDISRSFLGPWGAALTIVAIVSLSVTTGDTAFRSARLMFAECFGMNQKKVTPRLGLSVAVLTGGILFSLLDLTFLWTYFGWANQVLAGITLWLCSVYLARHNKLYWITLIPALFITLVCVSYISHQRIGLGLPLMVANILAVSVCTFLIMVFWYKIFYSQRTK